MHRVGKAIGKYESTGGDKVEMCWRTSCNFSFRVVGKVCGDASESGWVLRVGERLLYVRCSEVMSNSALRRMFMTRLPGSVCRLKTDEFLRFVEEDLESEVPLYTAVRSRGLCEAGGRRVWFFSDECVCDEDGVQLRGERLIGVEDRSRALVPSPRPVLGEARDAAVARLRELCGAMQRYYGPRFAQAFHVLATMARAVHRSAVMRGESQVHVANLSGPPNVGKSFASAIALRMAGADEMMLCRATPAAIVDAVDACRDLLLVWDDPRDVTRTQLSAIVHESFHGKATSTVSRGLRAHNSTMLIGTQERLLGLPFCDKNVPTFSRLSHIDMDVDAGGFAPSQEDEAALKKCLAGLPAVFPLLLGCRYSAKKVNRLHARLQRRAPGVLPRAVRGLAVDYAFAEDLGALMGCEARAYFEEVQPAFLRKFCSAESPIHLFAKDLLAVMERESYPPAMIKKLVTVDMKQVGPHACTAVHAKTYFDFLAKHGYNPDQVYTSDLIYSVLRESGGKYGETGRNVMFKHAGQGSVILRSLVVRRDFLASVGA